MTSYFYQEGFSSSNYPQSPSVNSFNFRQRIGELEWSKITAIDLEDLVVNLKIKELQNILDTITFSEINEKDLKTKSLRDISLLIKLMQYIIEYLLNSQELQYKLINSLSETIQNDKKKIKELKKFCLVVKEDNKIYSRQIILLRKNLSKLNSLTSENNVNNNYLSPPSKYPNIISLGKEKEDTSKELLSAVVEANNNSKNYFESLLKEFKSNLSDIIKENKSKNDTNNSNLNILKMNEMMLNQFNSSINNLINNFTQQFHQYQLHVTEQKENDEEKKIRDILKLSALKEKEDELNNKEKQLHERMIEIKKKEEELLKLNQSYIRNSYNKNENNIKQSLALKLILRIYKDATIKAKSKAFFKWYKKMISMREAEVSNTHSRQLIYASEGSSRKNLQIETLKQELEREVEKNLILTARNNFLLKENTDLKNSEEQNLNRNLNEPNLLKIIKSEKEKYLILSSKYETLQRKYNEEVHKAIEDYKDVIDEKDEKEEEKDEKDLNKTINNITNNYSFYERVEESLVKSPAKPQKEFEPQSPVKFPFLSLLPRHFLSGADESELLKIAEERISSKTNEKDLQYITVTTLARDIKEKENH